MAKRTVNFSNTIGAHQIPAGSDSRVEIKPVYTFDVAAVREWAAPAPLIFDRGVATTQLEQVADGQRVPWEFRFVFTNRQNQKITEFTEVRQFPADGLTTPINYNALELSQVVQPPEFGPSWAQQAKDARDEAVEAKEAAEAVGATNDTIMTAVGANPASSFAIQQAAAMDARIQAPSTLDFLGLVLAPISPARYGASMTGQNPNDGPALQLAVAAAQDRGYRASPIRFGNHRSTQRVEITKHNVVIEGEGGSLRGGGLKVGQTATAADLYVRIMDLTIDMEDTGARVVTTPLANMQAAAPNDAVVLDRVGRATLDNVRIFNARAGIIVPARNEHQHVRRVIMDKVEIQDCEYGWFSDQPTGYLYRYTVGDIHIDNSQWYNLRVVGFAHGLDGINLGMFKSFQRQNPQRARGWDLEYLNYANWNSVNLFESGLEALRLARFQNFRWSTGSIAWPGQRFPSSGILIEGDDIGVSGYGINLSGLSNIGIQKATKHGVEIIGNSDDIVIDPSVTVQGSGDPEFYVGDLAELAAIGTHYGFRIVPTGSTNGSGIRALGTTVDRLNAYSHAGEVASMDSLRVRKSVRTLQRTGTETSIDMAQGYERVVLSQSAPSTISFITAGMPGDELTLVAVNGNTTIKHGASSPAGASPVYLKGGANYTVPANTTLTLYYSNSSWVEK